MDKLDPTIVALAKAIKYAETGTGDTYTKRGASGEFGAYQFMPATYKNYSQKYLGSANTQPTRENQNRIVYSFIKSKKEQGYNPSQIASMWNAGEGRPDAYRQNWVGINSKGVKYDTPGYVKKVSSYYSQFKQPLQSQSTYEEPQNTPTFTADNPVVEEKSFLRKVGDFFTSGTQAFGKDIAEALTSGKNADMYSQAMDNYTQVLNNLQLEINKRQKNGQDTTKLISALQDFKSKTPKLEDFTGDTINKTTKQILGDAGMFGLELTSGGLLQGGKGMVANSGKLIKETMPIASKTLTTGQKILNAGKIGGVYGTIAGATGAMQENKSTGNIVLDSFVGGLLGAGLGAGLAGAGIGISKGISKTKAILNPTEKAFTNAQHNVARAYEKTLNLTPSQRAKEQELLNRTGDNIYTTLVKNHINLGSKEADTQLANVMKTYEKGIEIAQKNEHGLFNVNEVVQNVFKEIEEKIPSATARETAKNKIRKEVLLMLKEHKGTIIKNEEKQTLVDSAFMERLRKTGNSWTPFNASDPEKIGKSTGYALANAVRENVEKYGTFPEYRNAMKEWGKVIHVQQVLGKLEKSGKAQFRVLGGLSGAISRRILSGALGYHSGGLGGLILGELGGEYGARVMSNPALRTYLDRLIINNYNKKITPEVITKLVSQVEREIEKQNKLLKLPERTKTKAPLITPAPTTYEKPAEKIMNQSKIVDKAPITAQAKIIPNKANISKSVAPEVSKGKGTIPENSQTPKTVKVWIKSKFSDKGAYSEVPVIRKEENITLYQGSKMGEKRQFWTPNKKYAEQFGEVKEKTGTFYKIDNGNKVTDVYVEAPVKSLKPENSLISEAKKYKSAEEFVKAQLNRQTTSYTVYTNRTGDGKSPRIEVFSQAEADTIIKDMKEMGFSPLVTENNYAQPTKSQLTDIWNKANNK